MRIVFLGAGEFGLPTLAALHEAHELALVVTQPDRPAGRSRKMTPTPIGAFALDHALPLIRTADVNDDIVVQAIRAAAPDAVVVIAFGQKIGRAVIESPRLGASATMNLHSSLLPKYRGAGPIHWAILRGEERTGLTVIHLADKMDAGEMLGQVETSIDPMETAGELHDRLAALGPPLVLRVLSELENGRQKATPQDHAAASLAPKLSRADTMLDFARPAEEIRRRVHGLTPWPGVTVSWEGAGQGGMLLRRVKVLDQTTGGAAPGTLVDEAGVVACGDGAVQLLQVQPPGKRVMSWEEFSRGRRLPKGTLFHAAAKTPDR